MLHLRILNAAFAMLTLSVLCMAAGCSGGPSVKTIKIASPAEAALGEAKQILNRYSDGAPPTSEVDSFPQLVQKIREDAPAKADVVEEAFNAVQKNPGSRKSAASKALKQLKELEAKEPAAEGG